MKDIKTKDSSRKGIKTLNKASTWTERIKDPIVYLNDKSNEINSNNNNINEYGSDKIKYYSNRIKDETIHGAGKLVNKGKTSLINKIKRRNIKNTAGTSKIKTKVANAKNIMNNTKKAAQRSKQMGIQAKRLAISMARTTRRAVMAISKGVILGVKALISALSSLIGLLASGGAIVMIVIIVICLIAALLGSIFGIFFSNDSNSRTMTSVISEINQEVYRNVESQRLLSQADEIVFESTYSNWKEVIAVYSVKYANDNSEDAEIVMYLDDKNVRRLKTVFYDFNTIITEVRNEENANESSPPEFNNNPVNGQGKTILYVKVTSKSLEEIMNNYSFSDDQKEQVKELTSSEYDDMWSHLLYGSETGDYIYWRQKNASWSNIQIGNSGKTISDIGCLVTSVAILIQKSNVNNTILPFNPGIFVENLNNNNGFDNNGNLQYAAITKIIPNFQYKGRVTLAGKSKNEKLKLIKTYQEQGYYIAMEVLGDTGQHWVAVMNVVGNEIKMVDPSTDNIDVWNTYNWKNSSQFVYFQANLAS